MTINQDTFGNTYFGGVRPLEDGVIITQANFVSFLNTAYGNNRWFTSDNRYYHILFPSSLEQFSPPASSTNWRFQWDWQGAFNQINGSAQPSTSSPFFGTPGFNLTFSTNFGHFVYGVANNHSIAIAMLNRSGNNFNGQFTVVYGGYLKNSAYTSSSNSTLGLCGFGISTSFTSMAYRPAQINSTTQQELAVSGSVANYPITCTSATPGANVTDLILRDNTGTNFAIGACHNLLKTTANISVGQIFSLNADPDNNTQQNKWLCVGNWGSEKLLMRVWTENVT